MKKTVIVMSIILIFLIMSGCSRDATCGLGYTMIDSNCEWIDKYPSIETIESEFIGDFEPNGQTELLLPDWMDDSVMYEVNLRQYTEDGTIVSFMDELPRLQELGVEVLWLMPVHPISLVRRIGSLGSYYSISDYYAINPEFGSLDDFEVLVDTAHDMGFKIIMDVVFNHTGWDHSWINDHPDYYTQVGGEIIIPPGTNWQDVADLNMNNTELVNELSEILKYWVRDYDVDGFRCDYAVGVPKSVWETLRAETETVKEDVFFLAEDNTKTDWFDTFNSNYGGWDLLNVLTEIYLEDSNVSDLKDYLNHANETYLRGTFPLNFTTNHDINSWEGSNASRLGSSYHLMSFLTFALPGMPLIYSGQESSDEKTLAFFEKDLIRWNGYDEQEWLEFMIDLKQNNPALYNDNFSNSTYFIYNDNPNFLTFARVRDDSSNKVIVIANMSDITDAGFIHFGDLQGIWIDPETMEEVALHRITGMQLGAYEYQIYVQN